MVKLQYTNKIGVFEYIYFFMIVIYTAMGTPFTKAMMAFYNQPLGFAIPIIMTLILIIRRKVNFSNRNLYIILAIYFIWLILQTIKYNQIYPTISFFVFYNIMIAYILIQVYQTKMFLLYEKIVALLSVVALVGWMFMTIAPNAFGSLIDIIKMPKSETGIIRGNILVFSMTNLKIYQAEQVFGLTRNSGFSWEPGRYATMLLFALFFNLARTKFKFWGNRNFWILILALLTTQSTNGFMALAVIIVFLLFNKKLKYSIWYLILFVPLVILIYSLPFIGDKLSKLSDMKSTQEKVSSDLNSSNTTNTYVPQRFDGLAFEYMNIIHDPILGYGNEENNSFIKSKVSEFLALANGLLKVISRFGLILAALFYFSLYKSSRFLSEFYEIKGSAFFMILYMTLSVSYDLVTIPFFLAIILFSAFSLPEQKFMKNEQKIEKSVNPKQLIQA